MQVMTFLHKLVRPALSNIHKTRLEALIDTTRSLLSESQLTLTDLGRHMHGGAKVKHKIKRVDRLLSNKHLHDERFDIYQGLSKHTLAHMKEAIIIVDWSGCCSQKRWILQGSLVASGRSIPLYREIHPLEMISNHNIEKHFLNKLHQIIPKTTHVTILTDAGFRLPFLRHVKALGWDFGLRMSRTENLQRLEILLLISFIATVTLWLIGSLAESKGVHRDFQANSYRHKRVISVFNLGLQIIRQLPSLISVQSIKPTCEMIIAYQSGWL